MGSDLGVIMVGTWMLCGHGRGLIWTLSFDIIWHMGALREWTGSDLDAIMVGRHGWGTRIGLTSSDLDVSMVGTHGCTRMASEMDAGHPDGVGVRCNVWFEG